MPSSVGVMRVGVLTREYPPEVYGGAGAHVEFLVRELRRHVEVHVHCFGEPRAEADVHAYRPSAELVTANPALQTLDVDVQITAELAGTDVLHSHTWYANLAGVLGAQLLGVPHVLTAHSLEPLRPWKAEQLAGGYRISSWAERQAYESADAIVAVSHGMRADVLTAYPQVDPARVHVIHNGVDTEMFAPTDSEAALHRYGIDPSRPYLLFVGRVTRQKGLDHLLAAAAQLDPAIQVVLCASAPDTPELGAEVAGTVASLAETRTGVIWLREPLGRAELVQLFSRAAVFVCPSVYEPLGIVNLEAMACGAAVVASAVGGIPEVVADGESGVLVPYSADDIPAFRAGLAKAIGALCADPSGARAMGRAGRERAVREFSWPAIAEQTLDLYRSLL